MSLLANVSAAPANKVVETDTTEQAVEALADLTGSPQRRWVS